MSSTNNWEATCAGNTSVNKDFILYEFPRLCQLQDLFLSSIAWPWPFTSLGPRLFTWGIATSPSPSQGGPSGLKLACVISYYYVNFDSHNAQGSIHLKVCGLRHIITMLGKHRGKATWNRERWNIYCKAFSSPLKYNIRFLCSFCTGSFPNQLWCLV